jgi:hypothetical protein
LPGIIFSTFVVKHLTLKINLLFLFILTASVSKAQKIDSIYVNLYTDSLKKGTFNYINIDGLLPNGSYIPLDSTYLIFSASAGKFYGNNLFIDKNFKEDKVNIKVQLRQNLSQIKTFDMYIKRKPDNEILKTPEQIMSEIENKQKKKKKNSEH